ncbi:MFS transporter [Caballeronia sordidicola]|uniref:D-glucarate permease n=2 Tax=Caballeronia TaxID=1827195 RepID=A0A242M4A8_CABSO|nr:MFS transporter [Caballeronia sordidicola]OTP66026.1 D-glucarate permease [Caballeronia sordidicola]
MPNKIGKLRWGIVSMLVAPITFVMTLDRAAMTIAAPTIQKELGLSLVEMSVILTVYFWAYALGQVPAGRLAERHGSRKVLAGTSALWSFMMILTPLGTGFNWLVGCRALLGGAQSADWSSGVLAVKRWFPKSERAKGNSFLLGGLYLGPIVSAPLTAWMILQFGWHSVFYVFGAIGILLGVAWWFGYRDVPAKHPLIGTEEAAYIAAGQTESEVATKGVFLKCLKHPRFWLFGIQYFLLVLIQSFYTTWLPTYLMRARGLSLKSMGFAASLPWIAVFVAVFAAGIVCDKILKRTQSVWAARVPVAMAGFLVSAVTLCLASFAVNIAAVIGFLCLSFAAVGFVQVVVWSATQDLGRSFTGVMSGWTNLWGAASNVAGPMSVALMVKLTGHWASALVVIALAAGLGTVLWLFVHPEKPLFDAPPAELAPSTSKGLSSAISAEASEEVPS